MNTRERFHAIANFEPFDRLPILEWASWWDLTVESWHGEGLPTGLKDRYDICRHFGLDIYLQQWYSAIHCEAPKPESHGSGLIRDMEGYEALRRYLYPLGGRSPVDQEFLSGWTGLQKSGDAVFWISLDGFFWLPRTLLGIERHLYAFYDNPDLMKRINQENCEWMLATIDRICEVCVPDFMTFAEDMSYNNGPMLSKELFDEFMKPYYDLVVPRLKERGIRVFVDSDGDISEAAGWFTDAGIEGILPLEAQSGLDIVELRKNHPSLLLMGGFDKMTMPSGESAMRAEFERLLPLGADGGFFLSCDHQTPPGVSLENYRIYLDLFREYAGKAGETSISR